MPDESGNPAVEPEPTTTQPPTETSNPTPVNVDKLVEAKVTETLNAIIPKLFNQFQEGLIVKVKEVVTNEVSTQVNSNLEAIGSKISEKTTADVKLVLDDFAGKNGQAVAVGGGMGSQGDVFTGIMNLIKMFGGNGQNPMANMGQPNAQQQILETMKANFDLMQSMYAIPNEFKKDLRAEIWQDIKGVVQTGGDPFRAIESAPARASLNSPNGDGEDLAKRVTKRIKI